MRVFTLGAVLLAAVLPAMAADSKFPHATGRVTYKITSQVLNGTNTLSWIDHGKKIRQETKGTATGGAKGGMALDTWAISDGTHIYAYQPMMSAGAKQVMKMKIPPGQGGLGAASPLMAAAGEKGKVVGKGTIAGKPCEIRDIKGNKLWVWQGLPLKMEVAGGQGPRLTMEATRVETPVKLSANLFKVPAGYTIKEFDPHSIQPRGAPNGASPGAPGPR